MESVWVLGLDGPALISTCCHSALAARAATGALTVTAVERTLSQHTDKLIPVYTDGTPITWEDDNDAHIQVSRTLGSPTRPTRTCICTCTCTCTWTWTCACSSTCICGWVVVIIRVSRKGFQAPRRSSPTLRGVYSDYTLTDGSKPGVHRVRCIRRAHMLCRISIFGDLCVVYIEYTSASGRDSRERKMPVSRAGARRILTYLHWDSYS